MTNKYHKTLLLVMNLKGYEMISYFQPRSGAQAGNSQANFDYVYSLLNMQNLTTNQWQLNC